MNRKFVVTLAALIFVRHAAAKIFFDFEPEPLPLVEVQVVLPIGYEAKTLAESGAANTLGDILEAGTAKLTRQQLQDQLASYGASFDFSLSNQYSFWKLSFPVVEGKNYDGLATILAEIWATPRFNAETFGIAKTKLEAALHGSLDSDPSLAISTLRRWINKNAFGGFPIFRENLQRLKLETVKTVFARDFQNIPNLWAGVVAPEKNRAVVENILRKVFAKQGEVVVGPYPKQLEPRGLNQAHPPVVKKLFLIDKPGRNQSVTALVAVKPERLDAKRELGFLFGNHILVDSGLGSIFGEEIRTKRGLAYNVSGVSKYYLGMPSIGFVMNPLREKSDEAFRVVAGLLKSAYASASLFRELPVDVWDRQWRSFKYGKILDTSTADGRLSERMAVVTGDLSPALYARSPESWSVDRDSVQKTFADLWQGSVATMSVVGSAAELSPLLAKYFPDFQVQVVPYQDTIKASVY